MLLAILAARAAAQPHPEIVVGVDGTGRLAARYDSRKPYPRAASRFPCFDGYADVFPGFSPIFMAAPQLRGAQCGCRCQSDGRRGPMG